MQPAAGNSLKACLGHKSLNSALYSIIEPSDISLFAILTGSSTNMYVSNKLSRHGALTFGSLTGGITPGGPKHTRLHTAVCTRPRRPQIDLLHRLQRTSINIYARVSPCVKGSMTIAESDGHISCYPVSKLPFPHISQCKIAQDSVFLRPCSFDSNVI